MSHTNPPAFDPYLEWLNISLNERPIDHYRLLGVRMFEGDALVIRAAADERMKIVRTYQSGRRAIESQRLMNELAAAKTCLLDADTKATYDAVLQGQLASRATPLAPPVAKPQAGPPPPPPLALSQPVEPPQAESPESQAAEAPTAFYFQPWFPVLLVATVMLFAVAIWGIVVATRPSGEASPPVVNADSADDRPEPTGDAVVPEDDPLADAVLIRQEAGGEVNLSAATAVLDGPRLITSDDGNMIANITSPDDIIAWRFRIERPAAFRIEATYSTTPAAAGGEFVLATDHEQTKLLSTRDTGGAGSFTSERIGFLWLRRSGEHRISLVPKNIPDGQSLMTLKSMRLIPVSGTSVD